MVSWLAGFLSSLVLFAYQVIEQPHFLPFSLQNISLKFHSVWEEENIYHYIIKSQELCSALTTKLSYYNVGE